MEDLMAALRELISFTRYLFLSRQKLADDVCCKFFLKILFSFFSSGCTVAKEECS